MSASGTKTEAAKTLASAMEKIKQERLGKVAAARAAAAPTAKAEVSAMRVGMTEVVSSRMEHSLVGTRTKGKEVAPPPPPPARRESSSGRFAGAASAEAAEVMAAAPTTRAGASAVRVREAVSSGMEQSRVDTRAKGEEAAPPPPPPARRESSSGRFAGAASGNRTATYRGWASFAERPASSLGSHHDAEGGGGAAGEDDDASVASSGSQLETPGSLRKGFVPKADEVLDTRRGGQLSRESTTFSGGAGAPPRVDYQRGRRDNTGQLARASEWGGADEKEDEGVVVSKESYQQLMATLAALSAKVEQQARDIVYIKGSLASLAAPAPAPAPALVANPFDPSNPFESFPSFPEPELGLLDSGEGKAPAAPAAPVVVAPAPRPAPRAAIGEPVVAAAVPQVHR